MSKRGKNNLIVILSLTFLFACTESNQAKKDKEKKIQQKVISVLGNKEDYFHLYSIMSDTLNSWINGNVLSDSIADELNNNSLITITYKIDSIFAINSSKDKIISSLYQISKSDKTSYSHGIYEFFGAKIDGKWYYWRGGYTPIFKNANERNMSKPLPYSYLHKMGVGSLGGYLTKDGKINEAWFDGYFKGLGWGTFKERYKYKYYLDGQRIDNEKDYWEYLWKKKGIMLWKRKAYQDSIAKMKQENIQ